MKCRVNLCKVLQEKYTYIMMIIIKRDEIKHLCYKHGKLLHDLYLQLEQQGLTFLKHQTVV